jgi:hypothetical protein
MLFFGEARRNIPVCLFMIFLLSIVVAACTSRTSSSPSPRIIATKKIYISPVDLHGAPASGYRVKKILSHGYCVSGSETFGQAYRCFASNGIYDPCWAVQAPEPTVLCLFQPWSHDVTEIFLDQGLSPLDKADSVAPPWGIQLKSGLRCRLLEGTLDTVDGRVIDYYCGENLYLLRGLVMRGNLWRAQPVKWQAEHYIKVPETVITFAWYGILNRS